MSDSQLIGALKAASVRMQEQRRDLQRAQVLLRIWPDGLVFHCNIMARSGEEIRAGHLITVPWNDLPTLTPAKAVSIVDEVCAKARALLGVDQ